MNPLKSVGGRLSLALLLVVAAALGIAYLVIVPQLENRLVDSKLSQVEKVAATAAADAEIYRDDHLTAFDPPDWQTFIPGEARALNVNLVMYGFGNPPRVIAYSGGPGFPESDPLVNGYGGGSTKKDVARGNERYAEVTVSGPEVGTFLLVYDSLHDTLDTVNIVKRRLLYAGLLAFGIVLVVGFFGARMFARRIHRLERAADRIAAGHFDEAVVDTGEDELGQLAVAFDRMRQRLQQLEHARREFVANASHELRTPLFALAGLLELLDDEDLDDETRREFLTTAREQSDRLTRLATDLLDLNRLDAGRLHVERETVRLDELAEVLLGEFRAVANAKEHPLEVLGAPASAVADEQRVLQVGRVLLENAILHTPPGTTICVRTRTREGRAILSVEDDGSGIAEEHIKHVFERFYRVNGTVTSGSGLGLAIARELTELMGGRIDVESRPGRTVFTLSLTLAAVPAPAAHA